MEHATSHEDGFCRRLRRIIRLRFPSMMEFSRQCGIPYRTLRDYAFSGKKPGSDALVAISGSLGVSIDWLLLGTNKVPDRRQTDLEISLLIQAIEKTERVVSKQKRPLSAHEKAYCIATVYRLTLPMRTVSQDVVDQVVSSIGQSNVVSSGGNI